MDELEDIPSNFEVLKSNISRLRRLRFPLVQELQQMNDSSVPFSFGAESLSQGSMLMAV